MTQNQQNDIVGTLMAYTAFAEIYVDDIWVHPDYSGQTLGRQLLAGFENRFKRRGYNNMNLVTNAFQAPTFIKNVALHKNLYVKTSRAIG